MNKILLEMKELKLYYFATCYCEQHACKLEDPFKDKDVAKGYCEFLSQYYQKYIFGVLFIHIRKISILQ